jgi:hypothetical protein
MAGREVAGRAVAGRPSATLPAGTLTNGGAMVVRAAAAARIWALKALHPLLIWRLARTYRPRSDPCSTPRWRHLLSAIPSVGSPGRVRRRVPRLRSGSTTPRRKLVDHVSRVRQLTWAPPARELATVDCQSAAIPALDNSSSDVDRWSGKASDVANRLIRPVQCRANGGPRGPRTKRREHALYPFGPSLPTRTASSGARDAWAGPCPYARARPGFHELSIFLAQRDR